MTTATPTRKRADGSDAPDATARPIDDDTARIAAQQSGGAQRTAHSAADDIAVDAGDTPVSHRESQPPDGDTPRPGDGASRSAAVVPDLTRLGDLDLYLINEGRHRRLADALGAHVVTAPNGSIGTRFAVWAPNARRVSVVGGFNQWDGRANVMTTRSGGIWETFIAGVEAGALYKYELEDIHGNLLPLKADPVAQRFEPAPGTASIVPEQADFTWTDDDWMAHRAAHQRHDAPISVYELHPGSWRRPDGESPDWRRLATELVPYVRGLEFTHIELLPVMEHPFGGSWGYQPLGLFAPTARYGAPEDFAAFVDACHRAGLGVIVDWVPAHFPSDAHGLARFDGTALYEHEDPREGFHKDWNTLIYNFGRHEVRGFLIASALHWLEHFHIDGLRVDAVASMLYRDYSRAPGEWLPNVHGGRENLEAIAFLREMNDAVHALASGAITIAEESTAWPGVTQSTAAGGLGFDFKWNMGWMHDSLSYFGEDPLWRGWHGNKLTFGLVYAFSEHFMLPLSHDEVVHGKRSIVGRMPGADDWQKLANLRAAYTFMWTHPGKKLLFMGGEIAQWREWNHDGELDWWLLENPLHRGAQQLLRDLNRLYVDEPALHTGDADPRGFQWVIADDRENSVFAFLRKPVGTQGRVVLVVLNFTPLPRHGYRIGVPLPGEWTEVLNSDAACYGGGNLGNGGAVPAEDRPSHGEAQSLVLTLPPLGGLVLRAPE
ncbi:MULTISPECIES: 1,4-alpha-glucan branching protein GlgB [Derxia]|uniref:1,4-alpha-glucan branching enzyme GlgB n=1 Tax=Derxia gummosa DSM 723 TaxID=1121388 RepID=A0A8B6X8T1_9BURK|nr:MULTISPECIES: 1,4-alpha-glucan branching protein GlgB [Derxia]